MFAHAAAKPRITFTHPRTGKSIQIAISERLEATIIFSALYDPTITSLLPQLITDAAQLLLAAKPDRFFEPAALVILRRDDSLAGGA